MLGAVMACTDSQGQDTVWIDEVRTMMTTHYLMISVSQALGRAFDVDIVSLLNYHTHHCGTLFPLCT